MIDSAVIAAAVSKHFGYAGQFEDPSDGVRHGVGVDFDSLQALVENRVADLEHRCDVELTEDQRVEVCACLATIFQVGVVAAREEASAAGAEEPAEG